MSNFIDDFFFGKKRALLSYPITCFNSEIKCLKVNVSWAFPHWRMLLYWDSKTLPLWYFPQSLWESVSFRTLTSKEHSMKKWSIMLQEKWRSQEEKVIIHDIMIQSSQFLNTNHSQKMRISNRTTSHKTYQNFKLYSIDPHE